MENILTFASEYGTLLIVVAAFFDELVFTGFVLQGYTMAGVIVGLYTTGSVTLPQIVVTAILGSYSASLINFALGYHGQKIKAVANIANGKKAIWLKEKLEQRGLFMFMLICRFVTITRPIYAVFLGTLRIPVQKYLFFEFVVGLIWVLFWSLMILFGAELFTRLMA